MKERQKANIFKHIILCMSGDSFQVMEEIVQRTASGMHAEGKPFQGILFAGLMLKDGKVNYEPLSSIAFFWGRDS